MLGRRSQSSKSNEHKNRDHVNCKSKGKGKKSKFIKRSQIKVNKAERKTLQGRRNNLSNTEDVSLASKCESLNGAYNLRQYTRKNYLDYGSEIGGDDNQDYDFGVKRTQNRDRKDSDLDINDTIEYDRLPKNKASLLKLLSTLETSIEQQKFVWFKEQYELPNQISSVAETAVPINADVLKFDFKKLVNTQQKIAGKLFDVIMMDPPWQLSTSQPSRGVAIAYDSIKDEQLLNLPINSLQKEGFIFIWTINAKYKVAEQMLQKWGYKFVDELIWVKRTVNGKIAKGHGFYLQHAKENCLIGYKGNNMGTYNIESDVIWSERRGQSQKPEEIYTIIENLKPDGYYLEIFGRRNNLRANWVTIGNEL